MRLPLLESVSAIAQDREPVSIIYFALQPGGASAASEGLAPQWIDALSNVGFEALKHLLTAASIRKKDTTIEDAESQSASVEEIERIQTQIMKIMSKGAVRIGGVFPVLVARKARLH